MIGESSQTPTRPEGVSMPLQFSTHSLMIAEP